MLWACIAVLIIFVLVILFLIFKMQNLNNKKPYILAESILGALAFCLLIYIALSFGFSQSRKNQKPDNTNTQESFVSASFEESESESLSEMQSDTSAAAESLSHIAPSKSETMGKKEPVNTTAGKDEIKFKPVNHPDPLNFTKIKYPDRPILRKPNEIAEYLVRSFIGGKFDLTFYIPRNEFYAPVVIDRAFYCTRAYYLFGSCKIYNENTEDLKAKEGVTARFTITRYNEKTDIEAYNKAMDFVRKNPVPKGGFKTFKDEKEYMRKIHDYVVNLVTYDPMGFDPKDLFQTDIYDAKQEAYNALVEKSAVCAGYAKAVSLIAQCAGIDCAWVFGNETETDSHAWNVVFPCDGSAPQTVDATWDDHPNYDDPSKPLYTYFYIPVSKDTEHSIDEDMWNFLKYIHS